MFGRVLKYTCSAIVFYVLATGPLLLVAGHAQKNHQRNHIVENLLLPIVAADIVLTPKHPPLFSEAPHLSYCIVKLCFGIGTSLEIRR